MDFKIYASLHSKMLIGLSKVQYYQLLVAKNKRPA
jgi:hypothetical protein